MVLMFDPQYIRPDDVGTQRNKSLLLTKPDAVQEAESVAYRYRDQAGNEARSVQPVIHERRKAKSRDRRQSERRMTHQSSLLDTRTHRERRQQLRRQQDVTLPETESASDQSRVGINQVV